jgi:hypothetical protein
VEEGQRHYDNKGPAITEAASQIPDAWEAFIMTCAHFVHLTDDQRRGLVGLPDAEGALVFDLPSGAVLVERLLDRLPHQQHPGTLAHTVLATIRTPLTAEDRHHVIASATNRVPLDPTVVERFLQGYEPHNPQGTPDANVGPG